MAEVITVKVSKGGVGKTTIVANLGHMLAMKKYRVLLIDLDPQRNLTRHFIDEDKATSLTSSNLISEEIENEDNLIINIDKKLDLIRADIGLGQAVQFVVERLPKDFHNVLKSQLENLGFMKKYDFIIIDMSPGVADNITNIAFVASNTLITPINYNMVSLQGLTETILHLHKMNSSGITDMTIDDIIVVPNRYDKRTSVINDQVTKVFKENLEFGRVSNPIRENANYNKAYSKSISAVAYEASPENKYGHRRAIEDYEALAKLIIGESK